VDAPMEVSAAIAGAAESCECAERAMRCGAHRNETARLINACFGGKQGTPPFCVLAIFLGPPCRSSCPSMP
jgi:hypothetical protein